MTRRNRPRLRSSALKFVEYSDQHLDAFHEAGHAVMAHILGVPVEAIGIARNRSGGGYIDFAAEAEPPAGNMAALQVTLRAQVYVITAGMAAEVLITGGRYRVHACSEDYARARRLFEMLSTKLRDAGHSRRAVDYGITDVATRLLRPHMAAIRAIAAELLRRGRLTGDEIAGVIAGSSRFPSVG